MKSIFKKNKKPNRKVQKKERDDIASIRRKRKAKAYSDKINDIGLKISTLKKVVISIFMLLIIFAGSGYLLNGEQYQIKSIEIFGNKRLGNDILSDSLKDFELKNLVSIDKDVVLTHLRKNFIEVEDINIIKIYPDRLRIEIVENEPVVVYFDFDSIDLLTVTGILAGSSSGEGIQLEEYQRRILENGGDPDADYVRSRMQSEVEGAFKWDEVSAEERIEVLELMKAETDIEVKSFLDKTLENILLGNFSDLPIVYRKVFSDDIPLKDLILFVLDITEELGSQGLKVVKTNQLNSFDIAVELEDNKTLFFSQRRPQQDQLRDLRAVFLSGEFARGRIFDFRSQNYSIK